MKKIVTFYYGVLTDHLTGKVRHTRTRSSYREAHLAAEKLSKGSDRFNVSVETREIILNVVE